MQFARAANRDFPEAAQARGLKGVVSTRGAEAVSLAQIYRPVAISVGETLPDAHGWTVLGRLKRQPDLRHVPVQMIVGERGQCAARARGAVSCIAPPVSVPEVRKDLGAMLADPRPGGPSRRPLPTLRRKLPRPVRKCASERLASVKCRRSSRCRTLVRTLIG